MCDFGKIFRKFPVLFPKFYGRNNFVRKIFWIFQLSRQNFLDRPTFDRKFFGFFKFRTEKNSQKSQIRGRSCYGRFTAGSESVAELTPFFPTFAAKIFGIFNFQPENFPVFQLSSRKFFRPGTFNPKKSGGRNFSASVPGAIGRAGMHAGSCAPSVYW